jgi:hypothetical protein
VPCVASCDRAETAVAEQHHADVSHSHVSVRAALLAIFALL